MSIEYVSVAENESSDAIELPTEADGTLRLATVAAQFPGASGLRYKNPDTGAMRAVRLADGVLHPPPEFMCWSNNSIIVYTCTFPNKRKGDADSDGYYLAKRPDRKRCTDLIVLGLAYKVTEDELKEFFQSKYGDVVMSQIKRDMEGGSKGYGFIRFGEYSSQAECLANPRHQIDGRWCEVKVPISQGEIGAPTTLPRRVFVGRITEDLSEPVLKEFFGQYGSVEEVYIPKPFRAFAFVTFADSVVVDQLVGEDFVINGVSVHVGSANPKQTPSHLLMKQQQQQQQQMMMFGGRYQQPQQQQQRGWQHQNQQQQQQQQGGAGGGANLQQAVVQSLASNPQILAAALAQVTQMATGAAGGAAPAGDGSVANANVGQHAAANGAAAGRGAGGYGGGYW